MQARVESGHLTSVESAAQALCSAKGNFQIQQIIAATRLDRSIVRICLDALVRRGRLLAWPGERFAPPIAAAGASWPTELRPPLAALMGAR